MDEYHSGDPHIFEKARDRAMERLAEAAASGEVPPTVIEGLKRQVQQFQYESLRG